jgi:hypothetical protein
MFAKHLTHLLSLGCALTACATTASDDATDSAQAITDIPILGVRWTPNTTITTGIQDHSKINTESEVICNGGFSLSYDLHLTNVMQNRMHIQSVTVHFHSDFVNGEGHRYTGTRVFLGALRFYSQDGTPADVFIDLSNLGGFGNGNTVNIPVNADLEALKIAPDGLPVVGMDITASTNRLDNVNDGFDTCTANDIPYIEPQGVPGMNADFSINGPIANAWSQAVGWVAINGSTQQGVVHTWPRGGCFIQNFHAPDPGASGGIMWRGGAGSAFWMHGQVFKKYVRYCDTQNLGCPVGPEQTNGCRWWQDFEGGRVSFDRCPGGMDHSSERCLVNGGQPGGQQNDEELDNSIFP